MLHYPPGSSPRLWGTSNSATRSPTAARFIPTPVGNMPTSPYLRVRNSVHPHACGEHISRNAEKAAFDGSSPRLWGTLSRPPEPRRARRFIPTPVGNMARLRACPRAGPVHPHACGEHNLNSTTPGHTTGSSPRLWGTCEDGVFFPLRDRFIPTPVGNILFVATGSNNEAVHPHACGEHITGQRPTH